MTSRRTGDPWMKPADYAHSLRGLSVNLLVASIERALPFHRDVLAADIVYTDADIAVLQYDEAQWMLHADHTYDDHPLSGTLRETPLRGIGAELRLHGRDPDAAERAARRLGYLVLEPATDKAHGLREAFVIDTDGYLWVPDVKISP